MYNINQNVQNNGQPSNDMANSNKQERNHQTLQYSKKFNAFGITQLLNKYQLRRETNWLTCPNYKKIIKNEG